MCQIPDHFACYCKVHKADAEVDINENQTELTNKICGTNLPRVKTDNPGIGNDFKGDNFKQIPQKKITDTGARVSSCSKIKA